MIQNIHYETVRKAGDKVGGEGLRRICDASFEIGRLTWLILFGVRSLGFGFCFLVNLDRENLGLKGVKEKAR